MLTRRDGLIDLLRAKLVGVSSSITKPFVTEEILALAQQYVRVPALAESTYVRRAL